MFEEQQVIDRMRLFIRKEDQELSDELTRDAGHYYEMCRKANGRLRICAEYLRLGLRTEAIQLCEEEPNLLDLVAALDFPEMHEWTELTLSYQLQHEPLLLEFVESLNEAYAENEPLESLLTHFRLITLLGSPLKKRLEHLRTIASDDPFSPYWDDDVREFEKARFREMVDDARAATRNRDTSALAELMGELESDAWLEAPPRDLIRKVRTAHANLLKLHPSYAKWRQGLEEQEQRLRDAQAKNNVEAAYEAARRWYEMVKQLALPKNAPECTRVIPLLKWMRQSADGNENQIEM